MEEKISAYVFNAVDRDCGPKWSLGRGVLNHHNIMFITDGACDFYLDGEKYRLSAGDVIYYPSGADREANNQIPGTHLYAFDFYVYGCDRLPLPTVTRLSDFERFMPNIRSLFFTWYEKSEGYKLACSGIFMMILADLIYPTPRKKTNPHVNAMKEYIAEHLGGAVTVDMIARRVNLSPAYCGELFMKCEGVSIHEFINNLRINRAKDLLSEDELTVSEVAAAAGYLDVFYFSRKFRALTGMSPSQYRKLRTK